MSNMIYEGLLIARLKTVTGWGQYPTYGTSRSYESHSDRSEQSEVIKVHKAAKGLGLRLPKARSEGISSKAY